MSQHLKDAMAAQRPLTPYEKFRNKLFQIKGELAPLVGPNNVDRFVRTALNAVQANPKLLEADGRSLLNSCMKAAQDGLLPDGREAVFNIYNTKMKVDGREAWVPTVQYLPMVGGLIKKLYASGHVTKVDGVAVYEKDLFDYERGDDPKITHKPYGGSEEPGAIVAAYAIVKLANGEVKREVMWKRDLDKVRKAAKTDKGWGEWEDQFSIKSVLKRIYKQLPSSVEMDDIVNVDNEAMGFTGSATDIALLPDNVGTETANFTAPAESEKAPVERSVSPDDPAMQPAQSHDPVVTYATLIDRINNATDRDMLDADADLIQYVKAEENRTALRVAYESRLKEMTTRTAK